MVGPAKKNALLVGPQNNDALLVGPQLCQALFVGPERSLNDVAGKYLWITNPKVKIKKVNVGFSEYEDSDGS